MDKKEEKMIDLLQHVSILFLRDIITYDEQVALFKRIDPKFNPNKWEENKEA